MAFDPEKPYNQLPPLPPKVDVETKAILKKAIDARSALAELKGLGLTIPNQSILLDSLILQEAKTSSEIENIITTSDALFQAFSAKTGNIDPATKEVLRYREALWKGYNTLKKRPVLYLSKYIIEHKNDYYRHLRGVTEKNLWETWILFMLRAVEQTAVFTRERIIAIRDLMAQTTEKARKELPARVYSRELMEIIFHQPYAKGQFLVDAGIAQRKTAAEYLRALEKTGIMKSMKIGKEVLYLNVELYDLLSR